MTGTATAGMTAGARGSAGAHSAAGSALIATALETKNGQYLLDFFRFAFWAIYGFITPEHQLLKFLAAFAAFVFVNGHAFLPYKQLTVKFRGRITPCKRLFEHSLRHHFNYPFPTGQDLHPEPP